MPYMRIDNSNKLMQSFEPDEKDLAWDVEEFFNKVKKETINQYLN